MRNGGQRGRDRDGLIRSACPARAALPEAEAFTVHPGVPMRALFLLPAADHRLSLRRLIRPHISVRDAARGDADAVVRRIPGPRAGARRPRTKTIAYIVEEFRRAGLQPGNHGSWYQDVPLVEITAQDVTRRSSSPAAGRACQLQLPHRHVIGASYRVTAARRGQQQRHRLRRLRHQRARARLERLCRARRQRQDRHHPGQRSRLADARA